MKALSELSASFPSISSTIGHENLAPPGDGSSPRKTGNIAEESRLFFTICFVLSAISFIMPVFLMMSSIIMTSIRMSSIPNVFSEKIPLFREAEIFSKLIFDQMAINTQSISMINPRFTPFMSSIVVSVIAITAIVIEIIISPL